MCVHGQNYVHLLTETVVEIGESVRGKDVYILGTGTK